MKKPRIAIALLSFAMPFVSQITTASSDAHSYNECWIDRNPIWGGCDLYIGHRKILNDQNLDYCIAKAKELREAGLCELKETPKS